MRRHWELLVAGLLAALLWGLSDSGHAETPERPHLSDITAATEVVSAAAAIRYGAGAINPLVEGAQSLSIGYAGVFAAYMAANTWARKAGPHCPAAIQLLTQTHIGMTVAAIGGIAGMATGVGIGLGLAAAVASEPLGLAAARNECEVFHVPDRPSADPAPADASPSVLGHPGWGRH